mgnify:CR=1 FL=1|jgi:hypothetical protein
MKQFIHLGWVLLLLLIVAPGCKKKKDGGCTEAIMEVSTLPADGSVEPPSVGPDFPLKVNITSNLPTSGVSIVITARPEGASSEPFFSDTLTNVTQQTSEIMIVGTPTGSAATVDIVVTSNSCNTNKWTGNYRYSMK